MQQRYKLFYSPGACSLAPHIVLEELGVAFEPVRVVIAEGANRAPAYLAVNPRGRVPALQIVDGQNTRTMTEALAIMIYLAQRHPEAELLETAPESFAHTLEWMSWLGSTLHQTGIRTVLRPERFTTDAEGAPAIAARGLENVASAYADLEQRLPLHGYALGGRFTVLDAYLLVFYRWGNKVGLHMRERFPRYTALMDHVRVRPAVQRVIAREGIDLGA
jgi:glutathione S-transferase